MLLVLASTFFIILAGVPATTTPDGTFFVTTEPAATTEPWPILIPSSITAFAPIRTSSSIMQGYWIGGSNTPAIIAPAPIWNLLPIFPLAPITAFISTMV